MKFVFDIDGTICFDGNMIDPSIIEALDELAKAKHEIIFASARPIRDLLPVLPEHFRQEYLVGGNGAFTSKDGVIQVQYFNHDLLNKLISIIKNNQLKYLADSDWDYSFTGDKEHTIYKNIDKTQAIQRELLELHKICKMVLFKPTQEVIEEILTLPVAVTNYKGENAIDISPHGINKVKGLQNLNIEQFIAFGNDSNDQCLFENAIYSVCVGNHEVQHFASETITKEEVSYTIRKIMKQFGGN